MDSNKGRSVFPSAPKTRGRSPCSAPPIPGINCRHGIEAGRRDAQDLGVKKGLELGACTSGTRLDADAMSQKPLHIRTNFSRT